MFLVTQKKGRDYARLRGKMIGKSDINTRPKSNSMAEKFESKLSVIRSGLGKRLVFFTGVHICIKV